MDVAGKDGAIERLIKRWIQEFIQYMQSQLLTKQNLLIIICGFL